MASTSIQWTNKVWNPVTGCTKISLGCAHCYASRMAHRLNGRYGYPLAPNEFKVTLHPDKLDAPLHWKKPSMIFVDSMGDLFHKDVPDEYIERVFVQMAIAQRHTFQILTKRADRMKLWFDWMTEKIKTSVWPAVASWPLLNVWLGVSAENQATADERIPWLLKTPAAVRFVSVEPMLGPVDLGAVSYQGDTKYFLDVLDGRYSTTPPRGMGNAFAHGLASMRPLTWVICGGESGPKARPMHPDWVRSVRDHCRATDTPFFFKQWGEWTPGERGRLYREQTIDWADGQPMVKVGKEFAGKTLDGRQWIQFPEVTHV